MGYGYKERGVCILIKGSGRPRMGLCEQYILRQLHHSNEEKDISSAVAFALALERASEALIKHYVKHSISISISIAWRGRGVLWVTLVLG